MPTLRDKWGLPLGDLTFNVPLNSYSSIEAVHIFGDTSSLAAGFQVTWPIGKDQQVYIYPTTANSGDIGIASTDAGDDAATGEGAYTTQIWGLDYNYDQITEVVSLNGKVPVTLANNYLRFHRARVLTAGDSSTNLGDIYIGTGVGSFSAGGVPATILEIIESETAQSNSAVFTIPASHTGLIYPPNFQTNTNDDCMGAMFIRPENQVFYRDFNTALRVNKATSEQTDYPVRLEEKTDIQLIIERFATHTIYRSSVICDLILINNDFFSINTK